MGQINIKRNFKPWAVWVLIRLNLHFCCSWVKCWVSSVLLQLGVFFHIHGTRISPPVFLSVNHWVLIHSMILWSAWVACLKKRSLYHDFCMIQPSFFPFPLGTEWWVPYSVVIATIKLASSQDAASKPLAHTENNCSEKLPVRSLSTDWWFGCIARDRVKPGLKANNKMINSWSQVFQASQNPFCWKIIPKNCNESNILWVKALFL